MGCVVGGCATKKARRFAKLLGEGRNIVEGGTIGIIWIWGGLSKNVGGRMWIYAPFTYEWDLLEAVPACYNDDQHLLLTDIRLKQYIVDEIE